VKPHAPRGLERAPKSTARAPELVQMVAFFVGEGEYALDIMRIKEIVNPVKIRAVPKAPPFIEGVIELRGAILPVIDLRKRFDLPAPPPVRATKFVIVALEVQGRRMIVGLVVDGVSEPVRFARDQVRAAPSLALGESAYFSGVVHHQERILMVVDLDALLTPREKATLAGLEAPEAGS
jgi:purine-binding chemotaxis protein CheW